MSKIKIERMTDWNDCDQCGGSEDDISLLNLKYEEELAWLSTKLTSKFSDNTTLMQKLDQLEGKKNNAGITYKSGLK